MKNLHISLNPVYAKLITSTERVWKQNQTSIDPHIHQVQTFKHNTFLQETVLKEVLRGIFTLKKRHTNNGALTR